MSEPTVVSTTKPDATRSLAIIIAMVILFVVLILMFIFRYQLWGPNPEMTPDQTTAAGYGVYSEPIFGDCTTTTGHCSENGSQTVILNCIPNSKTGRGCLDSDGKQTFNTLISFQPCAAMCRTSIWQTSQASSECTVPPELLIPGAAGSVCIPKDTSGVSSVTQTCIPNDASGSNSCTYNIAYNSSEVIPDGCTKDAIGTVVTCGVGTVITRDQACVLGPEVPICGTWAIRNLVDAETYTAATYPCSYTSTPTPAAACFDNYGYPYTSIDDLLNPGWTTIPMGCVSQIDTTATGTTSSLGDGSVCQSLIPGVSCSQTPEVYNTLAVNVSTGTSTQVCVDPQRSVAPGCVRACLFYSESILPAGTWIPEIQFLVGKFWVMTASGPSGTYALTLNNVPCPGIGGQTIPAGLTYTTPPALLSDCFGNPNLPLVTTDMTWLNLDSVATSPSKYQLSTSCLGQSDTIRDYSSFYLTLKPVSHGNPNQLHCKILGTLGKNYVGWLGRSGNKLVWNQANLTPYPTAVGLQVSDPAVTTFILTYTATSNGINRYALSFESDDGVPIASTTIPNPDGTLSSINTSSIYFVTNPDINNPDLVAFQTLLNSRQTRWNPDSCNVFYSYPPPLGYPNPDIGTAV